MPIPTRREKGLTPTMWKQVEYLAAQAVARELDKRAEVDQPASREIRFHGSLDSRELLGNIADGIGQEIVKPLRRMFGWVKL